jgi:hypothetical protein
VFVSATVAALENAYTAADLFEKICQIRGDELDDAGTHALVHRIRREATHDEHVLDSYTHRYLGSLLATPWK